MSSSATYRFPRWTQKIGDTHYEVLDVSALQGRGDEAAAMFAAGLNYAEYEDREWIVPRGQPNWVVGCPMGLSYLLPDLSQVEPPAWAYPNGYGL